MRGTEAALAKLVRLHMPTFGVLIGFYGLAVAGMWLTPHDQRPDSFGRMDAHQLYAGIGRVLSFGMVNRQLVDWYMNAGTWPEIYALSDEYVMATTLRVTPVALVWCVVLATLVGIARRPERAAEHEDVRVSRDRHER